MKHLNFFFFFWQLLKGIMLRKIMACNWRLWFPRSLDCCPVASSWGDFLFYCYQATMCETISNAAWPLLRNGACSRLWFKADVWKSPWRWNSKDHIRSELRLKCVVPKSRSERVGLSAKVKEWIQSLAPKLLVMEQTETLELSLRIHTLQHLDDYSSLLFMFVW